MKRNFLYIGILVSNPGQRKTVLRQYSRFNTQPYRLMSFTPASIDWNHTTITGLTPTHYGWSARRLPFPQVVYNMTYSHDPALTQRIEQIIGTGRCFNHVTQLNKCATYEWLHGTELTEHLPDTAYYRRDLVIDFLECYSSVYLKPCHGNLGKSVYRIQRQANGDIHIGLNHLSPAIIERDINRLPAILEPLIGAAPFIIQRGIHVKEWNGHHFDIRLLLQKNKTGAWSVTNAVSRLAHARYYNTSICETVCFTEELLRKQFARDEVDSLLHDMYRIALRAATLLEGKAQLHMGEISVDLAMDMYNRLWIIELNGKPQKQLYRELRQPDVYRKPIEYASFLLQRSAASPTG